LDRPTGVARLVLRLHLQKLFVALLGIQQMLRLLRRHFARLDRHARLFFLRIILALVVGSFLLLVPLWLLRILVLILLLVFLFVGFILLILLLLLRLVLLILRLLVLLLL